MEKFKSFAVMFLTTGAACLLALKVYEQINKPKVAKPATTPVTTTPAS